MSHRSSSFSVTGRCEIYTTLRCPEASDYWQAGVFSSTMAYLKSSGSALSEMALSKHFRSSEMWRSSVAFFAILCLTFSLATRFDFSSVGTKSSGNTVQSHNVDAKRQHLLDKNINRTAPPPVFSVFEPPRSPVRFVSKVLPLPGACFKSQLHNRPPPFLLS